MEMRTISRHDMFYVLFSTCYFFLILRHLFVALNSKDRCPNHNT